MSVKVHISVTGNRGTITSFSGFSGGCSAKQPATNNDDVCQYCSFYNVFFKKSSREITIETFKRKIILVSNIIAMETRFPEKLVMIEEQYWQP